MILADCIAGIVPTADLISAFVPVRMILRIMIFLSENNAYHSWINLHFKHSNSLICISNIANSQKWENRHGKNRLSFYAIFVTRLFANTIACQY